MAKTEDSHTEDSSKQGDQQAPEEEQENAPLESASMTIVTSRRVIVDEVTGEISFTEGDDASPSKEAADDEDEETKAGLPAIEDESVAAAVSTPEETASSQAEESNDEGEDLESTSASSNRRLSKETLFAFALPEPVLQDMREKAAAGSSKPSAKSEEAPKDSGGSKGLLLLGGGLLLLAAAGGGYYFMQAASTTTDTPPATEQTAAVEKSDAKEASPENAESPPAEENTRLEIPAGELTPELLQTLSAAQLRKLLEKDDTDTRILVLKEVPKKKDVNLSLAALKLGDDDNFLVRVAVLRAFIDPASFPEEVQASIVAMIIARLDDEDEIVRGFAAKAIGEAGDPVALTKLRARLDLEESDVVLKNVRAAISKLEKL